MRSKAWHRRKHHFCRERYLKDFSAGFRAGYEDVANGGGECTPAFPPQSYWGWEYQSAEGQGRTAAWFAGYPQGARAAEEDGVGSWAQISMSSGLQAQYQQPPAANQQGVAYPLPNAGASQPMEYAPGPAMNVPGPAMNVPGPAMMQAPVNGAEPIIPSETQPILDGLLDPTAP